MAMVRIYDDEWWPVPCYSPVKEGYDFLGKPIEVPDEILAQYDEAEKAFNEAANKLANYNAS